MSASSFTFYEFFAGGGMARLGLGDRWACRFANDFDTTKRSNINVDYNHYFSGLGQHSRRLRNRVRPVHHRTRVGHVNDQRMVGRSSLGGENPRHGLHAQSRRSTERSDAETRR